MEGLNRERIRRRFSKESIGEAFGFVACIEVRARLESATQHQPKVDHQNAGREEREAPMHQREEHEGSKDECQERQNVELRQVDDVLHIRRATRHL